MIKSEFSYIREAVLIECAAKSIIKLIVRMSPPKKLLKGILLLLDKYLDVTLTTNIIVITESVV